jgi:hypothetical protein
MKIFTWAKRLFLTLSFLALIATNVLTLASAVFNAALSGMMSTAFGVQTIYTKHRAATKRFGNRLIKRTMRVTTASVAAIPSEAVPLIGLSVLIAGTLYELHAACDSMNDLDELYSDLGMADKVPHSVLHSICHPTLPDAGNRLLGDTCFRDGDCDSDECKKHTCVPNEFLDLPFKN